MDSGKFILMFKVKEDATHTQINQVKLMTLEPPPPTCEGNTTTSNNKDTPGGLSCVMTYVIVRYTGNNVYGVSDD